MNLICFPHYTCGGLLCDIMEDVMSEFGDHGGIQSLAHNMGKIGDNDTVFVDYDVDEFMKKVENWLNYPNWIGTHCWPGRLPCDQFDFIINITTTTYTSKIYRWLRAYTLYFAPQWQHLSGGELVDQIKAKAKFYLVPAEPVFADNVLNLEFADVVLQTEELHQALDRGRIPRSDNNPHLMRWAEQNKFLYESDIWNTVAARSFFHAEFEANLKRGYQWGTAKSYDI